MAAGTKLESGREGLVAGVRSGAGVAGACCSASPCDIPSCADEGDCLLSASPNFLFPATFQ